KEVRLVLSQLKPAGARNNTPNNSPGSKCARLGILIEPDPLVAASMVRILKREHRLMKVVVVGLPNQEDSVLQTLAAGADGVVLADESMSPLAAAIREVLT